jgi:hypothetical protein
MNQSIKNQRISGQASAINGQPASPQDIGYGLSGTLPNRAIRQASRCRGTTNDLSSRSPGKAMKTSVIDLPHKTNAERDDE